MSEGRYSLSSIDLLPPEAGPDVTWAIQEIEEGGRHQKDIWQEFNARLADRGIGPISHSAFGRYALKKREALGELSEVREIANAVTSALGPDDDDAVTRLLSQQLKTRIYARLRRMKEIDEKAAKEFSQALQALTAAEHKSSDRKSRHDKQVSDRVTKAVNEGVDKVAQAKGMSAETIDKIKREILGLAA